MQCSHRTLDTGSGMRTCLETSPRRLLNCSNSWEGRGGKAEVRLARLRVHWRTMQQEETMSRWISFSVKLLLAPDYADITRIYSNYVFTLLSERLHIFKEQTRDVFQVGLSTSVLLEDAQHQLFQSEHREAEPKEENYSHNGTICSLKNKQHQGLNTSLCLNTMNMQYTVRIQVVVSLKQSNTKHVFFTVISSELCEMIWQCRLTDASKSTEAQITCWILHMLLILYSGEGASIH